MTPKPGGCRLDAKAQDGRRWKCRQALGLKATRISWRAACPTSRLEFLEGKNTPGIEGKRSRASSLDLQNLSGEVSTVVSGTQFYTSPHGRAEAGAGRCAVWTLLGEKQAGWEGASLLRGPWLGGGVQAGRRALLGGCRNCLSIALPSGTGGGRQSESRRREIGQGCGTGRNVQGKTQG